MWEIISMKNKPRISWTSREGEDPPEIKIAPRFGAGSSFIVIGEAGSSLIFGGDEDAPNTSGDINVILSAASFNSSVGVVGSFLIGCAGCENASSYTMRHS